MPDQQTCFVISPIGAEGSDIRKRADMVLRYVIGPATSVVGLEAVRADKSNAPGNITVTLLDDLMSAKAIVADLTGLNPNVFYELAVAHSFQKPVVTIASADTNLPFDIFAERTIFFDYLDIRSIDDTIQRISSSLTAALEAPEQNSPISRVAERQTLRQGNPAERALAELTDQVQALRSEVRQPLTPETGWPPSSAFGSTTPDPLSRDGHAPPVSVGLVELLPKEALALLDVAQQDGWNKLSREDLDRLGRILSGLPPTTEARLLIEYVDRQGMLRDFGPA